MPLPDIRTMVLLANVVSLAVAVAFVVAWRLQGRGNRALAIWTTGFLARALGLLVVYLRPTIPDIVSFAVGNSLMIASIQLFLGGIRQFVGRRPQLGLHAVLALLGLPLLAAAFAWAPYANAVILILVPAVILDGCAAAALVRRTEPGMQTAQVLISGVFWAEIALSAVRIAWLLAGPAPTGLFTPSLVTALFYGHLTIAPILLGTGMIFLLYRQADLAERARVSDLEVALAQVRTLEGILPICAWCKRIRDEQDGWQPVEHYVAKRTAASFSHATCPDCAAKAEPGPAAATRSTITL